MRAEETRRVSFSSIGNHILRHGYILRDGAGAERKSAAFFLAESGKFFFTEK